MKKIAVCKSATLTYFNPSDNVAQSILLKLILAPIILSKIAQIFSSLNSKLVNVWGVIGDKNSWTEIGADMYSCIGSIDALNCVV